MLKRTPQQLLILSYGLLISTKLPMGLNFYRIPLQKIEMFSRRILMQSRTRLSVKTSLLVHLLKTLFLKKQRLSKKDPLIDHLKHPLDVQLQVTLPIKLGIIFQMLTLLFQVQLLKLQMDLLKPSLLIQELLKE